MKKTMLAAASLMLAVALAPSAAAAPQPSPRPAAAQFAPLISCQGPGQVTTINVIPPQGATNHPTVTVLRDPDALGGLNLGFVAVRGTDNAVWIREWAPSGGFFGTPWPTWNSGYGTDSNGWYSIGGNITSEPRLHTALYTPPGGNPYVTSVVVALGTNGVSYAKYWVDHGTGDPYWSGWHQLLNDGSYFNTRPVNTSTTWTYNGRSYAVLVGQVWTAPVTMCQWSNT